MRAIQFFRSLFLAGLVLACISACSDVQLPASLLATGRWSSLDGRETALIDLPNGLFQTYAVMPTGPVAILSAKNMVIESESFDPEQVTISYLLGDQRKRLTILIFWDDDHLSFHLGLVNSLTGQVQHLRYASDSTNLEG